MSDIAGESDRARIVRQDGLQPGTLERRHRSQLTITSGRATVVAENLVIVNCCTKYPHCRTMSLLLRRA